MAEPGRIWERTVIIALGIFLVLGLRFALDRNLAGNEVGRLHLASRFADAEFLKGDWCLDVETGGHRVLFQGVMWPLVRALPLIGVSIVGRLVGYALLSIGLAQIARRLRLDLFTAVVVGGVYVGMSQSLAAGEWMFGGIETKVFSYGFVLLAVASLMDRRLVRAGVFFGLAVNFHILVGGWAAVAGCLVMLAPSMGTWRRKLAAAATGLAVVLPGLVPSMRSLLKSAPHLRHDITWVYVYFRNPHHLNPLDPRFTSFANLWVLLAVIAAGVCFLWCVPRILPKARAAHVLAWFTLATLVPFVLGVVSAHLRLGAAFLQLYPFRVSATLMPLFSMALAVAVMMRAAPGRVTRCVWGAAAVLVFLVACVRLGQGVQRLREYPEGRGDTVAGSQADWHDVCRWVRMNSEDDARVLSPPGHASGKHLMRRPGVVHFKLVPSNKASIDEWYDRLVALNAGRRFTQTGLQVQEELDRNFASLSAEEYRQLARRYGASLLVIPRRDGLPLKQRYANDTWAVYSLEERRGEGMS